MGWLRATKTKKNPQATALSQLKEELRRVAEKLESHQGEFAEALEQHVPDLKSEVETALTGVQNSAGNLGTSTLLTNLRLRPSLSCDQTEVDG